MHAPLVILLSEISKIQMGIAGRRRRAKRLPDNITTHIFYIEIVSPRHCHYKEKEIGWPHPPTAERKTRAYSNVLGARRRQKKDGRPKMT